MRPTSVYRWGRWVKVEDINEQPERRAMHIISDNMDAIQSMADGRHYDSKSRYRAELKARGCVEVGNDAQANRAPETMSKLWNREPVEISIKRAIEGLERR